MKYAYHPKVTIIIPVYNGELYMKYAIDSALNQTYDNIEVLVINDGSMDKTDKIAKEYGDRIRYIAKENGGVSTVLNMAIREMEGDWLSWLSHDDVYLPNKIESQIKQLNEIVEKQGVKNIDRYVLSCQAQRINEAGKILPRGTKSHPVYTDKYDLICKEICNYSIGGCTVMASKSTYLSLGGFDEKNITVSDTDMWFRMMLNDYTFVFSDDQLVQSRYHKNMVSIQKNNLVKVERTQFYNSTIEIIKPYLSRQQVESMALSMIKAGMDEVSENAMNGMDRSFLFRLKVLMTKLKKSLKSILRNMYRKVVWG